MGRAESGVAKRLDAISAHIEESKRSSAFNTSIVQAQLQKGSVLFNLIENMSSDHQKKIEGGSIG